MKIQPTVIREVPRQDTNDQRGPAASFKDQSTLSSYGGYDCLAPFKYAWSCIVKFFNFLFCGYCCKTEETSVQQKEESLVKKELKAFKEFLRDNWEDEKSFQATYKDAWEKLDAETQEACIESCKTILTKRNGERGPDQLQYDAQETRHAAESFMESPLLSGRTMIFYQGKSYENSARDLIFEVIKQVLKNCGE